MAHPASRIRSRSDIPLAKRIVVKVGSSSLTSIEGGLNVRALRDLAAVLAERVAAGTEVVLVSSGAIAAGLAPLGMKQRPSDLAGLQAVASVGQGVLAAEYASTFGAHHIVTGQVLLTADDLEKREHSLNAARTLDALLHLGVLPIVNENDAVTTLEIKFGDNDRLAALVANLIRADVLLLFSDVDALYDGPPEHGGSQRIPQVGKESDLSGLTIGAAGRAGVGSGGMITKVQAARIASTTGIPALVTRTDLATQALAGDDVGTWFSISGSGKPAKLVWLQHLANTEGRLVIDRGAVRAITEGHKSLLPAGVVGVTGEFDAGDPVDVADEQGRTVARGVIKYSSLDARRMAGRSTHELAQDLGPEYERELIHRSNLALL